MPAVPAHKSDPAKPRYQQLADTLRADILAGTTPPDRFPTESVLCARHGVSRFTVREALRSLQSEGLIQRRRGSGTVVRATAAKGVLHQPLSNLDEILQYSRDTSITFTPVEGDTLPRAVAKEIGAPDMRWLHFAGVRRRAGQDAPIALTDAFISGSLREVMGQVDLAGGALFAQLERHAGLRIAKITQAIQAVPATAAIATALGIARRSACLRIVRCYLDAGARIVEVSVSHHPGGRFAYAMQVDVSR